MKPQKFQMSNFKMQLFHKKMNRQLKADRVHKYTLRGDKMKTVNTRPHQQGKYKKKLTSKIGQELRVGLTNLK